MPEYWRKGIGQKLCQVVCEEISKKGITTITLWVLESNMQARQFYESQGFFATGDVEVDYFDGNAISEVRYKKSINQM